MKKWLETANCWKSAFHDFNIEDYDCLVIDVEGMELEVLRSFAEADILCNFTGLNVECSRQSWYEGGTPAQEVIDYLAKQGFAQDSPIDEHDDIMFINKITQ